ncbi:MAG: carboxypeptidase regulatory-like domain-containing protein [Candidatus Cloacimonetes bacterium]|nr:carboxypeptidase regulatory-like domain-containing protein [Candidatus Cloacimonadota bacterium]
MKKIVLFVIFIIIVTQLFSASSETYFKFSITSKKELSKLTRIISIDNVKGNEVFAYANEKEFSEFKTLGYEFEILSNPSIIANVQMADSKEQMRDWDYYPTYETYVDMMYQFEEDYPDLCIVQNIGNSVEGREIIFAKISDNVNLAEDEPEFMYTATMHGDELVGYILMLRLIDYILTNYTIDPRVANLVNNAEIWINPLANPDGTYAGGNSSVNGATRYNANYVDLNRNYPDPQDGSHPDGNSWQPETTAMMDLANAHNFVLSSNLHSGAEVVNYPWDTWSQLAADDDWWQEVSHTYADAVHNNAPSNYMDGFDNGITNGYDWYTINGGRQDYMNYFQGCREMTLELSNEKMLPASQLNAHWNYNQEAFLLYMEECLYGIRGIVTNESGQPLDATITIIDHDFDNSEVFTDSEIGDFHRMIAPGTYDISVSSYSYISETITNINVSDGNITSVNVVLGQAESITITGTVTDGNTESPIQGATVEILDVPIEPTTTNLNGEYIFENILEDTYSFRVSAENYASVTETIEVSEENKIIDFQLFASSAESFENGEFGDNWSFTGNANWFIDNSTSYDGIYSAKSGDIGDNQYSSLSIQIETIADGEIIFWKKVSSESSYDFLKFYIDDSEYGSWSGEINWSEESYSVSAGTHTFKWVYEKDYSVSDGSDCGWIDYITFPPTEQPIIYGDVNGDADVTSYDAALTLQYSAGLTDFEEWQILAADVDGNGIVQAFDAAIILQYSAGIITEFPVEGK